MKDVILSRLSHVKGNGRRYRAKCPNAEHRSGNQTLSLLFNDDGRTLIHCHAGCEANDVLASIGLSLSDLYPDGAIRDFMASCAARDKQHDMKDVYLLEIGKARREQGVRMSPADLKAEREAYLRTRG